MANVTFISILLFILSVICVVKAADFQFKRGRSKRDTRPHAKEPRHKIRDAKIMLCTILKDEELYVDEWLRYHRYLGFDFAYLFDNGDEPSAYLASLPQVYGPYVKVIRHEGKNQQREVYNNCTQRFKDKNTWAAFIDMDEFIVLRKHATIREFLHDVVPKGGAVVLNWSRFSNNGTQKHEPGPILSRFTYTTKELNHHTKTIAYLKHVHWPDVHNAYLLPGHLTVDVQGRPHKDNTPFLEEHSGNKEVACINHYHSKSFEEYLLKRRRSEPGGASENYTNLVLTFDEYNRPYAEVKDTFARDFYLRHFLGKEYHTLFVKPQYKVVLPPVEEEPEKKSWSSSWW